MKLDAMMPQILRSAMGVVLCGLTLPLLGQTITQTVVLQPGANAVFLEVTPADAKISDVFADAAIASVWEPRVRNSTVSFISNPNSIPFNTAGWMVYVPTNNPQSVNNDLYSVAGNTPYIVNVLGTNTVNLTISGRPGLLPQPFTPSAYTLRGFPIDPANPPSVLEFFQPSSAHYANGALNPIFRYNSTTQQWQQVNADDQMARDVAYWVFTTGSSSYMAPLSATCPIGDGLDFGTAASQLTLTLTNTTSNQMTVTISDLGGLPRPLVYQAATSNNLVAWVPLPQSFTTNIGPGGILPVNLGVQRSQIVNGSYATVLELNDGNGTLLRVPVTAQASTYLQSGLWVGDITVNAVAQTYHNFTNSTAPTTPVSQPFVMRAMLHVKPDGETRLLKEAIEMQQSPSTNVNGNVVTVTPGQTVLLTDKSLVPEFTGVVLRDGVAVGRRISTAAFDFDAPGGTNFLAMAGRFGVNSAVSVNIVLQPTTPTNPFLHRYNPDHDNLDANYQPLSTNVPPEVYTVTRQISFTFTPTDPSGQTSTDYGVNEIGGTYNETLLGLDSNPIVVSGTFHLVHTLPEQYLNVVQ